MRQASARLFARPALAAAALTFFVGILPLVVGLFPMGLDYSRFEVPLYCELQRAIAASESFFLSKNFGNGGPLYAHPHAQLFYPFRWITVVLAPEAAAALSVVLQLCVGAAGTAALARTFGVQKATAVLAGATYAFSGITIDLIKHASYLAGGVWLPVVWAGARLFLLARGRATPKLRGLSLAAVFLGTSLMLFGGEPQSVFIAAACIGIDALVIVVRRRRIDLHRTALDILRTAMAGGAGALVGGLLWIPVFADFALGRRSLTGLDTEEALLAAFPFELWPALLIPNLLTETGHEFLTYAGVMAPIDELLWNASPFVLAPLLVAFPAALLIRRARPTFGLGVFFFLCAAGSSTPFFPTLLALVPSLASFRFPAKYLVPFCLITVVVGALVFDVARTHVRVRRILVIGSIAVTAVLFCAVAVTWAAPELFDDVIGPGARQNYPGRLEPYSVVFRRLCVFALLGPVPALVMLLSHRLRGHTFLAIFIVTVFFASRAIPLAPSVLNEPGVLDLLSSERPDPVIICYSQHTRMNLSTDKEVGWDEAAQEVAIFRSGLTEIQACYGLSSPIEYAPNASRMAVFLNARLQRSPAVTARALGCDYTLTAAETDPPGFHGVSWAEVAGVDVQRIEGNRLLVVNEPIPLFFVSDAPTLMPSENDVLRAIFAGAEPTRIIDVPTGETVDIPQGPPNIRTLSMERDGMDHITLHVDGTGPGVVGVRQSYRIGFTATQQGKTLPLVRVGGMFLGVVVDDLSAGPVTLRYQPPRLVAGFVSFGAGVAVFVLTILFSLKTPARRNEQ